jgi:hypothetical protein
LGIFAIWIKGNAKGLLQARYKYLIAADFIATVSGSQDTNAPGHAFGDEDIAIRCCTNEPRIIEATREKLNFKARRNLQ